VPKAAADARISVTTPGGTATSSASFDVILRPEINSFSPASGRVGSTVTIKGHHLDYVTEVTLGGVDTGAVTLEGHNELRVAVPEGVARGSFRATNVAGTSAP